MKRTMYLLLSVLVLLSMLLGACNTSTPTPTEAPVQPTEVPPTAAPAAAALKVGQVTDLGGINDKSFNASAWKGVEDAKSLGVEGKYLESQGQSDYAKNIQQFVDEKTGLIVTVGFLLGVDTAKFAQANPDTKFAIVDYAYPDCWPGAVVGKDCGSDKDIANVRGLTFQTDQAGFLAGYLAAGMTKTGKVGTFGGINIPTVAIFMKGYEAGVLYFNQKHSAKVEVVGWNTTKGDGLFTGNFESTDDGRKMAESLMQENVDIIMPVAGPVGLGSAAVCKETGGCMIIGVDADWYETAAEYKDVVLTSVLKKIDVAVNNTIKDTLAGKFTGGTMTYTIADGGVDIAPYHDFDSKVPADLKKEVEQAKADLIAGTLTVDGVLAGAPAPAPAVALKVGQVTDLGGINDKSFNASAWKGVEDAKSLGVEGKYLESQGQSDYAKNIQQFVDEKTGLIVTVGFLLGVDTAKFAQANPDTKFAIVDYAYPDCWPGAVVGKDCGSDKDIANVRGLTFQTDQAGFLAGYLAAGMTKTGKVGTFGGINIPTVAIFMKGYEAGVKYYNEKHSAKVEVVGWNTTKGDGLFTGNFESTDDGRKMAESLMQENVDIIMPVAGPVGLGSAAVCKETGGCMIIGVDADWYETAAEYKDVVLTSVLKKIDVAVNNTIKDTLAGKFTGGTVTYTIKDGGVDIAPYHDFDSKVPADLKKEVEQAKADLIAGTITVDSVLSGVPVPTPAPTPVPAAVCAPLADAPKAAAGELGSPDNPIVITFVPSGDTGKITKAGTAIADCLAQMTGLSFKMEVGTSFGASIEAMGAEKAQVGFLNTFSVLLGEQKYGIVPALVAIRKYNTNDIDPDASLKGQLQPFYKGQFIASTASGIKSFADLKGKTFCFVDPNSTSGYIVPRIILKANGIDSDVDFKATVNAGSHNNVAIAVYKGDCDAGVTYINVLTDTSANLAATYADIADKVKPFAVSDKIPNDGMQFIKGLKPELQKIIVQGMLAMAADPGGKAVLKSLYNYDAFQEVQPDFYNAFADVLKAAGVDPASLVK